MTTWKIDPSGAAELLTKVHTASDELAAGLTQDKFQSALDGLTWGGVLTQGVAHAVNSVLKEQQSNVQNIENRITAGTVGVGNAVIAYNNGQTEMSSTYQDELLKSAESGDFSYFVDNGHQA